MLNKYFKCWIDVNRIERNKKWKVDSYVDADRWSNFEVLHKLSREWMLTSRYKVNLSRLEQQDILCQVSDKIFCFRKWFFSMFFNFWFSDVFRWNRQKQLSRGVLYNKDLWKFRKIHRNEDLSESLACNFIKRETLALVFLF